MTPVLINPLRTVNVRASGYPLAMSEQHLKEVGTWNPSTTIHSGRRITKTSANQIQAKCPIFVTYNVEVKSSKPPSKWCLSRNIREIHPHVHLSTQCKSSLLGPGMLFWVIRADGVPERSAAPCLAEQGPACVGLVGEGL